MSSKNFSKCVIHVLEGHRRQQNCSQSNLAFKVGLTQSDISHLEVGRKELKIYEMTNICKVLDLGVEDVLLQAESLYKTFTGFIEKK